MVGAGAPVGTGVLGAPVVGGFVGPSGSLIQQSARPAWKKKQHVDTTKLTHATPRLASSVLFFNVDIQHQCSSNCRAEARAGGVWSFDVVFVRYVGELSA